MIFILRWWWKNVYLIIGKRSIKAYRNNILDSATWARSWQELSTVIDLPKSTLVTDCKGLGHWTRSLEVCIRLPHHPSNTVPTSRMGMDGDSSPTGDLRSRSSAYMMGGEVIDGTWPPVVGLEFYNENIFLYRSQWIQPTRQRPQSLRLREYPSRLRWTINCWFGASSTWHDPINKPLTVPRFTIGMCTCVYPGKCRILCSLVWQLSLKYTNIKLNYFDN